MTNRRAMELLMIERSCVRRGSGMEWITEPNYDNPNIVYGGYRKVHEECNRDCANCELIQNSIELLEMYDMVIQKMIEETEKEEANDSGWKEWQINAEEEKYGTLTI